MESQVFRKKEIQNVVKFGILALEQTVRFVNCQFNS